jgi:hypothetical protein
LRSAIIFWIAIAHSTAAATEFEQNAITHRLDEPPAKRAHDWCSRLAPLAHDLRRARLVLAHQARVADDIGGKYRR